MAEEKKDGKTQDGNIMVDLIPGEPKRIHAWDLVVGTDFPVKVLLGHDALMDRVLHISGKPVKKKEGRV